MLGFGRLDFSFHLSDLAQIIEFTSAPWVTLFIYKIGSVILPEWSCSQA